ncbi:MAG TPA: reverse transcriptase domain-containing protein [Edaphocola sp.]|nr:reverse transcriptase domain-containing protein [Edaphocola sp.]
MEVKKKKDWFKIKRYPHIGLPLDNRDRFKWIESYVTNPNEIAEHAFLPFIHKTSKVKKFRKDYSNLDGSLNEKFKSGTKVLRKESEKKRELFYASHLDSLIFSYYAMLLSNAYEDKIKENQLDEVVNAYRSVPVNPSKIDSSNKCNIDFANDVFKYVLNYKEDEFTVIAFDISSFFDNLNHKLLREVWADVLGVEKLPIDHFNVFKNITRFSHVDIVDIFEEFKDKIYTRKINKLGEPLEIKQKKVDKIKYLRNQDAIAFCKEKEFFKLKGKLLQPSKTRIIDDVEVYRDFGIPQGSPISSVLANIYLLHFDTLVNKFISANCGIYRRYSDDMVVICPIACKEELTQLVYKEIKKYKLEIQEKKTQIFQFKRNDKKLICGQEFEGVTNWNKNFIYLGFEFDGNNVLLKSASISGYYRKMKRSVRRAKHFSSRKYNPDKGIIFKRRIFKKFSYKGAKRNRKFIWNEDEKKYIKTDSYNWGNFLSYAYKASNIMVNNKIKQQTKRHWNILNKLIK